MGSQSSVIGDKDSPSPWRGAVPPPVPSQYRNQAASSDLPKDAPPVVAKAKPLPRRVDRPRKRRSTPAIELEVESRNRSKSSESKGWMSSFVIHLLILALIALIVAPANLGRGDKHEIVMSLGEGSSVGLESTFEIDVAPDQGEDSVMATGGDQVVAVSVMKPIQIGGGQSGQEAPKGSFFGIEASGHTFVYILDMSGSMKGRRYENACRELVRSVEGLDPAQNFYVLLFSSGVTQMFNASDFRPSPIAANEANRRRLSTWLSGSFKGGWTDPREALKVAMRMDPSAIFMLSDGEFKYKAKVAGLPANALGVVNASRSQAQIHAIAFEDPRSCQNMRQLARVTGGKYRFVGKAGSTDESDQAKRFLHTAKQTVSKGDFALAKLQFAKIIDELGHTNAGWDARVEYANMLNANADQTDLDSVIEALMAIRRFDSKAVVTTDLQQTMTVQALELASSKPPVVASKTVQQLADSFASSGVPPQVCEPVAENLVVKSMDYIEQNDLPKAMLQLAAVINRFPSARVTRKAKAEMEKLASSFLKRAQQIRRSKGNVAYARHLRGLAQQFPKTDLSTSANTELQKLKQDLTDQIKAKRAEGDNAAAAALSDEFVLAFNSGVTSGKISLSSKQEDRAQRALNLVEKRLKTRKLSDTRMVISYEAIVKRYPGTKAALAAEKKIEAIEADSSGAEMTMEMLLE